MLNFFPTPVAVLMIPVVVPPSGGDMITEDGNQMVTED